MSASQPSSPNRLTPANLLAQKASNRLARQRRSNIWCRCSACGATGSNVSNCSCSHATCSRLRMCDTSTPMDAV
eukprot:601143-Prymnesium_polylepis.1